MNATTRTHRKGAGLPPAQGLYDPRFEHESCGVGFVCHVKGRASRGIVDDAKHINCSMDHRGGIGYEPNTGDGAGILTSLPHKLLARVARTDLGRSLPEPGRYGAGNVFLPHDAAERRACKERIEAIIAAQGQECLGWRALPVDAMRADLGSAAVASMPHMEQLFIAASPRVDGKRFERQLYVIRKHASRELRGDERLAERALLYFSSLSSKVIVYKGMLTPHQLFEFFDDLEDPDYETHLAMVHSRFSTNTFPSWDRAQPNRFMSHNGEINTLLGNCNWMNAREGVMRSELFGDDLAKLFPVVEPDCSDSGNFDNVLEFLLMAGRTLPAAVMMMIPEAWQNRHDMAPDKRAFYEYNSCLMEPWDGPASIVFTDGTSIGAVLDRNGLRPSRYYVTDDDRCIMASEVGVLPVDPECVVEKGRLRPGRLFFIDFEAGRMVPDHEIKADWARRRPYGEWLARQRLDLDDLDRPGQGEVPGLDEDALLQRMQAFGYTTETMQFMLLDLVRERRDPLGSMGNDAALAVLSDKPRMLYDYFKQRFAQVTNPAIDSIREEVIMSLECYIGPEANLLEVTESHAHRLRVPHPILTNEELAALARIDTRGWRARTLDITFPRGSGEAGLREALARIETQATQAIDEGYSLLVLSDRAAGAERVAISALLATGCVHHHLVRTHSRTRIGLVVETGEAREVHQHCLLIGYGADAINPWLAFESLWYARRSGLFADCEHIRSDADVVAAYRKGVAKGVLKVLAKMGISTLQSYKGAQIFEAVGLGRGAGGALLRGHREPGGGGRLRGAGRGDGAPSPHRLPRPAARCAARAAQPRRLPLAQRRRSAHVGPLRDRRPPGRRAHQLRGRVLAIRKARQRAEHPPGDAARTAGLHAGGAAGRPRRGGAGGGDRAAFRDRCDELRLHLRGGPPDARGGHEPHRRQVEHRRGRRGPEAVRAVAERRFRAFRHQAGRERPLRRHHRVPDRVRRASDQDRAGREAGRGRRAAGAQGRRQHRPDPPLDPGGGAHQPAAAPRHLLDRGHRAAHPRSEELEPAGAHQRQARGRDRRRHRRGRGHQGAGRPSRDRGRHRRHRRIAAHLHQARRRALGARHRRDPPDAGDEQPALAGGAANRRTAQDRP